MADDTTPRGRTYVAGRAVERVARRLAQEVDGVVTRNAPAGVVAMLTSDLPVVAVESAGRHHRLAVRIAVSWDHDARAVAAAVQRSVRRRVAETTGDVVDRVDVTVAALVASDPERTERRRVR